MLNYTIHYLNRPGMLVRSVDIVLTRWLNG